MTRRRCVTPGTVPVWVSSGRWGPRRARVEQCTTLRAELVYHQALCAGEPLCPGSRLELTWRPDSDEHLGTGASWPIDAEVVCNAVWRRGRVFLLCPGCRRRVTRVYIPVKGLQPRCRQCWGLAYESQRWCYKAGGLLEFLGPIAYATTARRRDQRRIASLERYRIRRELHAVGEVGRGSRRTQKDRRP